MKYENVYLLKESVGLLRQECEAVKDEHLRSKLLAALETIRTSPTPIIDYGTNYRLCFADLPESPIDDPITRKQIFRWFYKNIPRFLEEDEYFFANTVYY